MKEFKKIRINFSLAILVLFILILLCATLLLLFSFTHLSDKWSAILGGGVVASVTALFQYAISYLDYRNNERLAISKVKNFLTSRDNKDYYTKLIRDSGGRIDCFFFTAKRFCDDFCTDGGNDNLLIKRLNENQRIRVRLMVQDRSMLPESLQRDFDSIIDKLNELSRRFGERFSVKTYSHIPAHNIFITDKDAIIGPYFNNKKSKYSHSIHFEESADFIKDYKDYFEQEWSDGTDYHTPST